MSAPTALCGRSQPIRLGTPAPQRARRLRLASAVPREGGGAAADRGAVAYPARALGFLLGETGAAA
jgi:hypothetical protein